MAEYAYDGMKRRTLANNYVSGSLDHTRHYYYSDDWQIVEERIDSSTDPDRQFVWGQRYTDDLLFRDRDTDSNGTLDERLYCLQDDNWNVVAIADDAGDIQERYSYDAYGLVNFLTPAFASRASSDFDWESLFAGYRWDAATELYQVRNRYLHALLGCWLIRDPEGYDATQFNFFRYVQNNPFNGVDPTGLAVYIAVRALAVPSPTGANYGYIIIVPDNPKNFPNLKYRRDNPKHLIDTYMEQGWWKPDCKPKLGMTIGAHNVDGKLQIKYNETADVAAMREGSDPKRYKGTSSSSDKSGWGFIKHKVTTPKGQTDTDFINDIVTAARNYELNAGIKEWGIPYRPFRTNCNLTANSILAEGGVSKEARRKAFDFKGIDFGETTRLPSRLFRWKGADSVDTYENYLNPSIAPAKED